jgi:hypothetical protein
MNSLKTIKNTNTFISLVIFLIAGTLYFYSAGNYVLIFQETQALFIFSGEYLNSFMLKPGGLLEYAGRYLTQFYVDPIIGPVVLSVVLTLPGLIIFFINKRLIPGISYSLLFLLIPSFLMLLMQANYYHMMEYNLGFVMILLFYLFMISSGKKYHEILILALFPLFYYLTGAFALIFLVLYIAHNLIITKGRLKYINSSLMLTTGLLSFLVFYKVLFLQTYEHLLLYPLPILQNRGYKIIALLLSAYIVLYPSLSRVTSLLIIRRFNKKLYSYFAVILIFSITSLLLFRLYNPQTARVIELEKLVFDEKWNEAISLHEKSPSRNLIGQYFYNIALSETDQLCNRLFNGAQDFGTGSLVLPWGDDHLNRGAYFYYSIGLINEAHRWAYEEMVVYGARPQNIKILAKTSLINGDLIMARKYLNILKKTYFYRTWAEKYEKLAENPVLIQSDPDLGAKLKILPKSSFFIKFNEPQTNLPLLIKSQPDNRKAFEYNMAVFLLNKNLDGVIGSISGMKERGFVFIPRYIEEAILIYQNSTHTYPDLGGLSINPSTRARFESYFAAYVAARKNPATLKDKMQKDFGNTYWYYFHFK